MSNFLAYFSYTSTVKRLSGLQKDRPQDAKALAIYWIEYVIRHHGAPHLHYPAADLNIFQVNLLDVVGFLLVCCYLIYKIIAMTVRKIWKIKIFCVKIKVEKNVPYHTPRVSYLLYP